MTPLVFKALPHVQQLHRIVKPMTAAEIDKAAFRVNHDPTENQKKAGNFKMGHIRWQGLDITIETSRGYPRRGRDSNGKPWETNMAAHYGFIRGAVGKDRDPLDVFVGEHPESEMVFVIDQRSNRDDRFDEHKVIIGARSANEVKAIYDGSYSPGWKGFMMVRWSRYATTNTMPAPRDTQTWTIISTPPASCGFTTLPTPSGPWRAMCSASRHSRRVWPGECWRWHGPCTKPPLWNIGMVGAVGPP